ncbi:MAG: hypothetical protein ATN36_02625 [Epulopiscium sp. Nele67-Bin005]|nr:MAG: hypothetical protein ATN36_02625 [Epulopiscium sp. Nele67-Bin005]
MNRMFPPPRPQSPSPPPPPRPMPVPIDIGVVNTLKFWANNSYEHVEIIQSAHNAVGATLEPMFAEQLQRLYQEFDTVNMNILYNQYPSNFSELFDKYLTANKEFLALLESLKFEGYNGYPSLYETVQHIIFEQLYTHQVLMNSNFPTNFELNLEIDPNMFTTELNSQVTDLKGAMYFWSLIGAEHTSIISTASQFDDNLPDITKNILAYFRTTFNSFNYVLSNPEASYVGYINVLADNFVEVNVQFLSVLNNFKNSNSTLLPNTIKVTLSPLFGLVLNHIIREHERVIELMRAFNN